MPQFSKTSLQKLDSCDPRLQNLFLTVIQHMDCSVLEGHRPKDIQNKHFVEGKSKVKWPHSKHNVKPSKAIDVAPYPINWEDILRFHQFAFFVKGIALQLGLKIRWGGDWDNDHNTQDNRFNDLPHFELLD